ncbi:FAD dependent oxidoreductase-1 [Coleophoma cylindrospora]|uniref:FAD dependent oxidoreductase-1 n=1 Tax=Coleophoma cylindrospora TaxID=1849047 RepID=A0A3D8QWM6_9HELO|nr:FAD dependent oxidoreductase-1 [Coleophoma cylindrospora]
MASNPPPSSVLIVGSGVFGLSTAYSLAQSTRYSSTKITVVDRSPFPSADGSSIDTSRIIRADYSDAAYAGLAAAAQEEWRKLGPKDLGGSGRYSESGLALVANEGEHGEEYVRHSFENVKTLMAQSGDRDGLEELKGSEAIKRFVSTGGCTGTWGYVNKRSGWANAEEAMKWLRQKVEETGRVEFIHGEVARLLKSASSSAQNKKKVTGIQLTNNTTITADLTILATGAWTSKLVNLNGRATATGQALVYMDITPEEQAALSKMPVLLNMSTGMFIIPPTGNVLKIARHGFGYTNPVQIQNPDAEEKEIIETSLPLTTTDEPNLVVPAEGIQACRKALREMIPSLGERPFKHSRICWYTDTPKGDFLITYHPDFEGLFLATGGSGHGFKFLSVIGDAIVDCVDRRCRKEFVEKWAWPKNVVAEVVTQDGSRGGPSGMILKREMQKGSKI